MLQSQLIAHRRSFAIAASMFMNSNSLPIALMQSLITTVPGLKWGPEDGKSAMIGRALTYLVLHSTLGMVVRHSSSLACYSLVSYTDI
jgi:auxin efflux carrier family protein